MARFVCLANDRVGLFWVSEAGPCRSWARGNPGSHAQKYGDRRIPKASQTTWLRAGKNWHEWGFPVLSCSIRVSNRCLSDLDCSQLAFKREIPHVSRPSAAAVMPWKRPQYLAWMGAGSTSTTREASPLIAGQLTLAIQAQTRFNLFSWLRISRRCVRLLH
jgi:hypothetical protein